MNWKLQRNEKGWFTGLLVNENGDTKPQPRDKNGKFIKQKTDRLETYIPFDYKFPELPILPELNWKLPIIELPVFQEINFELTVLPPITGNVFIETQYNAEDVRKAFIAGINSGRSYLSLEQRADIYMSGVINDKETLAQRKV